MQFIELQSIGFFEALVRVGLACLFGFLLGIDRGRKNKPTDFRVYMVVAMTSCLIAITSREIYAMLQGTSDQISFDFFRIIQGVLVGIGFLGAGAIIKKPDEQIVIGATTGASIWSSGVIGVMLGFGLYPLAGIAFFFLLIILVIFGFLKKPLFDEKDQENI